MSLCTLQINLWTLKLRICFLSEGLDPTNEHSEAINMRLGTLKMEGGIPKMRLCALNMGLAHRNCGFKL